MAPRPASPGQNSDEPDLSLPAGFRLLRRHHLTPEERAFRKTFSQKKKRGRPKKFDFGEEMNNLVAQVAFENKTSRGKMNEMYHMLVLHELFPDKEMDYEWVRTHKTVLYELGRVPDADDARALYKQVRELNLTVRAAVAAIRQWRIGHAPKCSVSGLANQILKLLSGYRRTHPETTEEDIETGLQRASNIVTEHYHPSAESED